MDAPHEDTRALVIGGTQGLGLAIARRLRDEGCRQLVVSGRDEGRGRAAAEPLGATFLPVDLGDSAAVIALVEAAAERMGGVTALVCAGASTDRGSVLDTTPEAWDAWRAARAGTAHEAVRGP